jgi:hypothetical protein
MTEVHLDRYRDGDTTVNVMIEVTKNGGVERKSRATEATRLYPDGRREKLTGKALERFLALHHGQGRRVV